MPLLALRKYNVTLSGGTAGSDLVRLSIRKAASDSFATGSDWSPSAGDVKVSKDGGSQANIGTLPSYNNGSWEFTLTGTELSAKTVRVIASNASIIAEDITIETFGNASAMYPMVYSAGDAANPLTAGTGTNSINVDGSGNVPPIPAANRSVRSGTAQGGSSSTITLDVGASATNNFYNGQRVKITSGTGAGQSRAITAYVGASKVATVESNWITSPDNTSVFSVIDADAGSVQYYLPSASTIADDVAAVILQNPEYPLSNHSDGSLDANVTAWALATGAGGNPLIDVSTTNNLSFGGNGYLITSTGGYELGQSPTDFGLATSAQSQLILNSVTNIAVTGAAMNATAASATYTTGTDTGGVSKTYTLDQQYDQVATAGGTIDCYYQFSLGSNGQTGTGVEWSGYTGLSIAANVYAWNWTSSAWDQIGSIPATDTSEVYQSFELTNSHTGTAGNAGLVKIRFYATAASGSLFTDRILCGYVVPLTAPQIAAAVLTDTTDVTTAGSLGYLVGHAPSWYTAPSTPPTVAQIATAVWTDITTGDFNVAGSVGKIVFAQLGGAFTAGTSIFTVPALQNAPAGGGGGGGATVQQIVQALAGTTMTVVSNVGQGSVTIDHGAAYSPTYNNPLNFTAPTNTSWPADLTGWTISFDASKSERNPNVGSETVSWSMTIITASGNGQQIQLSLTTAQTETLAVGRYDFVILGTPPASSDNVPLLRGPLVVLA